jgi:hypothetical protein
VAVPVAAPWAIATLALMLLALGARRANRRR